MRKTEHILYYLILAMMLLPAVQKELGLFSETPLQGDFKPAAKPEFTRQSWMNGEYQSRFDQYLNDNIGFNPFLVRLNNQLDWSLFNYIHADGVVKGKGGQLFEYDYIRSYTGQDYLGEKYIGKKMNRLKFLQDFLKDSLDIDLIFVFEPGKASFYPEYIPEKDMKKLSRPSNYSILLSMADNLGISYIDLNRWFTQLKPNAPYPMYGQYGTHWSLYGMSLAADSLLTLIEQTRGIHLRNASVDTYVVEDQARDPDYDMASAMNLMFKLKDKEPLAYPVYRFEEKREGIDYPMVLVVGDSYYWNIFNTGIPRELFKNESFWYFGKLVYPDYYIQPTYVEELDIQAEIEKQEVILLMTTERFLYKFDWKLADNLYDIYGMTSEYDKVYDYIGQITGDDVWFSNLISKAEMLQISLEDMLYKDAKYIYGLQEPVNHAVYYGVRDAEDRIRKDSAWLADVAEKARVKNIGIDEMIREDAEYLLSTRSPEAFLIYSRIRDNMEIIRNDSSLYRQIEADARYYRIDPEEMLFIRAEKMPGIPGQ